MPIKKPLSRKSRPWKKLSTADNLLNLPTAKLDKRSRRRLSRWGIIAGNLILLVGVGLFVITNRTASQTVRTSTVNSLSTTSGSIPNPLDQLSADQIALTAAELTKLPELTMVRNRADSSVALLAVVANDTTTLAKPQVVSTKQKSHLDIIFYKVGKHDSVTKLADKFHVSANNIRWSNNLTSDSLTPGTTIAIPPGDGLVYQVKSSDTIDSIVNQFQANKNTFVTVNDAEQNNLRVGEWVWIPNAVHPVATTALALTTGGFANINLPRSGSYVYTGPRDSNGYDFGWCTWWAAHRYNQTHSSPLPTNLGDAYTWASAAQGQGMQVSFRPRAGAALQFTGRNHVGFVEKVDSNGDVEISEMNAAGWDVVSRSTIPASQAGNYKYIY